MSSLRSQIDALASDLASAVVDAIRGSSLQELLGTKDGGARRGPGRPRNVDSVDGGMPDPLSTSPGRKKAGKPGRLPRRSAKDIAAALGDVVALVKKHKEGLRAEEIRTNIGLQAKEMPRILREGISTKALSKKGQKRATVYFAR